MSPLNVKLQTHSVISTSGTTCRDAEGRAMQELLPRNLTSIECIKISPAGRNDTLLIKLSILSVVALVENTATHGAMYIFNKANFR